MNLNTAPHKFTSLLLVICFVGINSVVIYLDFTVGLLTSAFGLLAVISYFISKSAILSRADGEIKKSLRAIGNSSQNWYLTLPLPMLIADGSGKLVWYNDEIAALIERGAVHGERDIAKLIPGLNFEKILSLAEDGKEEKSVGMNVGSKYYQVYCQKHAKTDRDGSDYYNIYLFDLTEYKHYESKYMDEKAIILLLEIDNYDDLISELKESQRPSLQAELDTTISMWVARNNGTLKKFDKSKYLVIMSNLYFENVVSKRFEILDRIREIEVDANFTPTLSIGVSLGDMTYYDMERESYAALEMALARGGDQAVVKNGADFDFYGGKSKAVEKRNRVKARVIAHGLRSILDESSNVYVMGHQYPDMDAFGAAIGIHKAARDRGKISKIVLTEANETIKAVYDTFEDVASEYFIDPRDALDIFDRENDLLIVVDTHRANFTECPELLELAERKVVFDHHRRSVDVIENTLLSYIEPYSSSTCELVTEVLQYMEKTPKLSKREADSLLAGIILDTKSLTVKTGVRTFETCAILRRFGADTTDVKQFMQDDMRSFVTRSNIVKNARKHRDDIAISVLDDSIENCRLIAAQAADEMLKIRGINTSFVVVREGARVYVSARSQKDFNVQVIMEKLGGGGHLTSAGAQFTDKSVEEVEKILLETIDRMIDEEEKNS